jgi:hypothetical protein
MDGELLGVRRGDIEERFDDGEHCAICGADDEKLLEVAVTDEDECALACRVCLKKHGRDLDEDSDDTDQEAGHDADGDMDDDMR